MPLPLLTTDGSRRPRLIAAAALALILLAATVIYALQPRHHESTTDAPPGTSVSVSPHQDASPGVAGLVEVPMVDDPEDFARGVAEVVFGWDTTTTNTPADLIDRLVGVADPSGESSAGLVSDVSNYLPTVEAWKQLRRYATRQWIEVTTAEVPTLWATALDQAGSGLLPGTTAYTIRGIRHRAGVWEGEPVSTAHDVAFTVFVVCGPSYPQCHLLRLSQLDEPLD